MKQNIGLFIAIILTIASVILTVASVDIVLSFIRIKKNGTEINAKIINVYYNSWSSPPDRIYSMEFTDSNGKTVRKEYENYTTNTDRFNIGESVNMVIDYKKPTDFWYYQDLKTRFILNLIIALTMYILTLIAWKYREKIQKAFDRGDIQFGD
jgi:hypothetical protein